MRACFVHDGLRVRLGERGVDSCFHAISVGLCRRIQRRIRRIRRDGLVHPLLMVSERFVATNHEFLTNTFVSPSPGRFCFLTHLSPSQRTHLSRRDRPGCPQSASFPAPSPREDTLAYIKTPCWPGRGAIISPEKKKEKTFRFRVGFSGGITLVPVTRL
jgi:hypothetical protein